MQDSVAIAGESQPLLRPDLEQGDDCGAASEQVVDFDPSGDPENPLEWPAPFKWTIVSLLALMAFTVTFTCISIVPVANRIVQDLGHGQYSKSASVLLVTIWELGEAAGPLFISPLSEVLGRYPVMNTANCLFILATILAALSQSTPVFIAARALTGLAVASNVLNPAIVGDMFVSEQRGSAMSLFMLTPLIGGAVGPAISGAIAQTLGWRQVLWMSALLAVACEATFLVFFKETYKVPILRRKAARLRQSSPEAPLKTAFDNGEARGGGKGALLESLLRPAVILADSGVLFVLSLYGSVEFAFFYIMSVTLPDILEGIYGLSPAAAGSAFMSFSIGSLLSVLLCNLTLDRIYVKLRDAHKDDGHHPEYRLPLSILGAFTFPISVAAYGWIAEHRLPLPLLLLSVGVQGVTLLLAELPLMAYVVDAFGLYSASAMTGVIVTRCLMGTFLPLTTAPLIEHLGHGWAFTVLAGLCLLLAPTPVLVMQYGARWRQRSKYTRDA